MNSNRSTLHFSYSAALLSFFIGAVYLCGQTGASARVFGKAYPLSDSDLPVLMVKKTDELYDLWKARGTRGRIIVNIGLFFHFVPPEEDYPLEELQNIALKKEEALHRFDRSVSYRNLLWTAMERNIARRIIHVLPPEVFARLLARESRTKAGGKREITADCLGSGRILTSELPAVTEPVVLNIDASFFESRDPASLAAVLKKSRLSADLVTLCLSEDNPDVSDGARQRLREFRTLFSGRQAL